MEEELHEGPLCRHFAGLDGAARMPDETAILRFGHSRESQQLPPQVLTAIDATLAQQGLMLKTGTVVDATIIAAPNEGPHRRGSDSGPVHTVIGTAANVADIAQAQGLLYEQETDAWGDAGYQGMDKRAECQSGAVRWEVALRPGKRRRPDPMREVDRLLEVKQQFGYAKVRYRGLAKNAARLTTLFALGNLWMVRARLLAMQK